MKKLLKGLICAGLCGVLAFGVAGCKKESDHRDPETQPLRLAIGKTDQNFNPLFYTAQNDGEIANMTQVGLLTADGDGKLAYGEDQPTVALDYQEIYYSDKAANNVIGTGNGRDEPEYNVTPAPKTQTTAYEILIKNDMKFSDGVHDLTVMDVLFNLYVYLDPVYSGSNTIYSTKIKGLASYRAQQEIDDDDTSAGSNNQLYYARAAQRITNLIEWSEDDGDEKALLAQDDSNQLKKDYLTVVSLYEKELTSDWNAIETSWTESYKEYRFTEPWQVFYYIEGVISNQTEQNDNGAWVDRKDENGKYLTTLDPDKKGDVEHQGLADEINAELTDEKINKYMSDNQVTDREFARTALQRDYAINHVKTANTAGTQIDYVLTYCATSNTALDAFMKEEISKDRPTGALSIPTISGITVTHTAERDNKFNGKTYTEDHDILRIEINGVDPKAKWNFGFTVAPMYYYSDEEHYNAAMEDYKNGDVYKGTATNFGVSYKNSTWFDNVLQDGEKNKVPVGAGPYMCCTHNYTTDNVTGGDFFWNGMAFFVRNESFKTMGSGIENAKIKYVTYKEMSDDKVVEALKTKEIDYGEPTATADNQIALNTGTLSQIPYLTGGYGYIGINPKYVPDIEVRRAIMHALNTDSMIEYYGEDLVNLINRPISTTSWAYPDGATRFYDRWTETQDIIDLVESSGNWRYDRDKKKLVSRDGSNTPLKLTFTIAGETTDHPAHQMFLDAETFLEQCGFEISVVTDVRAMQNLAAGNLAVWAAAWSSSIDPDPYQIYSTNSGASSTRNWNKDGILTSGENGDYGEEYKIAMELTKRIEEGRQTINQFDREDIYGKSEGTSKSTGKASEIGTTDLTKLCALDLIMEMAVEFPTYQRNDLCVYNSAVIDANSLHSPATFNMGPISELWKISYLA